MNSMNYLSQRPTASSILAGSSKPNPQTRFSGSELDCVNQQTEQALEWFGENLGMDFSGVSLNDYEVRQDLVDGAVQAVDGEYPTIHQP
jgi:hypothetical protein